MPAQAIFAHRAFTPREEISDAVVVVENQHIIAVGSRNEVTLPPGAIHREARGLTIVPGFVDVHIHGAGGHDVMEGTPEALRAITRTVAGRGTTSLVATTVTASEERTCQSVASIAAWMRSVPGCSGRASYLKRRFWECTSRVHLSVRRAGVCIRTTGLCRLRSIYSRNFGTPHKAPREF